jgi:hypothetical protein
MWGSSYFGTSYFDADYFGLYTPATVTATPLDPQWLMLLVGRPIVATAAGTGPSTFFVSVSDTVSVSPGIMSVLVTDTASDSMIVSVRVTDASSSPMIRGVLVGDYI